jgi:hypothetical protein
MLTYSFDACGDLTGEVQGTGAPPQIIGQPIGQLVSAGDFASFSVTVANASGVTFQWAFNGTDVTGATGDSLLLPAVSAVNVGDYSVTVTNSAGTVTSSAATLALDAGFSAASPPRLSAYSDPGGTVTVAPFQRGYGVVEPVTLTATPSAPGVFVGWSGISTGDLMAITNPVIVRMPADMTVRAWFAAPVPLPEGMVAFWRGETDASDLIGGHLGTFYIGTTPTMPNMTPLGKVGGAFNFDGTVYIQVLDSAALKLSHMTAEAWVAPAAPGYNAVIACGSSTSNDDTWYLGVTNGFPQFLSHSNDLLAAPSAIPMNQWTHLAISFDGTAKRLYVNGRPVASKSGLGTLIYDPAPVPVTIGGGWALNAPTDVFNGWIDEVSLYDRALTDGEIFDIYNADIAGKNAAAPYITTNSPLPDATIDTGYTQQLATVLGSAPVTFALSAGALPPGMTLSPGGVVSGAPTAPGVFDVTVTATDASGNAAAKLYVLTVGPLVVPPPPGPQITTQPALATAIVGRGYTQAFTCTGGTPPVSYTLAVASVTPPGLTLTSAGVLSGTPTMAGGFAFTVVATDAAGLFDEQPCTVQAYQSAPAPAGMLGWWKAEDNALDSAGANNGVLRGGAGYAAGEVGQAFSLDGATGCVQIPDTPALRPTSLTVEAWVLPDSITGVRVVFAKPLGSGSSDSYVVWLNSGILNGQVCDATGCTQLSAPAALTAGAWYHVAYTIDDSAKQQVLYVNGVQVASAAATVSPGYDTQPLFLGRDTENTQPNYFLQGRIDEATLYNRALTLAEIASIYNAGPAGKQPVPVPVVAGVSPASGQVAGGEAVTVTGSGFTNATRVSFGAVAATNLAVASDTQLTVTSPPAATSATVEVNVTTPVGTSATSAADQFTYLPVPVVAGVSPASGLVAGGDTVTVTGSGFTNATGVSFGAVAATNLAVASDTQLTVTSPAAATSGAVDVTVTTPGGTSATSAADQFTYG